MRGRTHSVGPRILFHYWQLEHVFASSPRKPLRSLTIRCPARSSTGNLRQWTPRDIVICLGESADVDVLQLTARYEAYHRQLNRFWLVKAADTSMKSSKGALFPQ